MGPTGRASVKNVSLLFLCEALSRTASLVMLSSMALIGQRLTPNPALATLPLALAPVATMIVTVPAAQLMQRRGRKLGFALGAAVGVVGGMVGCLAVYQGNFALLCLGGLGIGAVNGFATYYRFAAGEVVAEDFRSRAISLVMAGGVMWPQYRDPIWRRGRGRGFPIIYSLVLFWGLPSVHALVLPVLWFVSFPALSAEEQRAGGRSLREIARQADFVLAVIGAVAAWGLMSLLMNATPLAMKRHLHSFADTAWVIQWHVLGMYVPSFFTGTSDLALGRASDYVRWHCVAWVLHCGQFEWYRAVSLYDWVGTIGRGVEFSFRRVNVAIGDDAPARGKGTGAIV